MRYGVRIPEVEAALVQAETAEELAAAFRRVLEVARTTNGDRAIRGRRLFARVLDEAIPATVQKLGLADYEQPKSNDNVVIIGTEFGIGGHTEIAADISRGIGAERTTFVLTDLYLSRKYSAPGDIGFGKFHYRSLLLLQARSLLERTLELYRILQAIRPTRIFLVCHHMDVVSIVATYPFRSIVDFIHHGDHTPSLGATLPYSGHADVTYTCHLACSEVGLPATYAGMTLPDVQKPEPRPRAGDRLRFATAGGLHKYDGAVRYRWTDWVVACLQAPGSDFVHIGPWSDEFAAEVREALSAAGLEPGRYEFAGPVRSVQRALLFLQADVYVGSYPMAGFRSNLEANVLGLPCILPLEPEAGPFFQYASPLPGWIPAGSPAEIPEILGRLDALRERLKTPEFAAAVRDDLRRFEDFVAGRPIPAAGPRRGALPEDLAAAAG